jgi:hypothetical protein
MGLRTMNYRANTIGASFEIKPNHDDGTIVTCVLPLKNGLKAHRHGSNGSDHASALNGSSKCASESAVEAVADTY